MAWAFWRRDTTAHAGKPRRGKAAGAERDDEADALRARARRRLIGAAALLLAAVIVVPMILDPAPKPLPSNIPIDLPSEKAPFKPRLTLPPVPEAANAPMVPPPDAAAAPAKESRAEPAPKTAAKGDATAEVAKAEATKAPARDATKSAAPAAGGKVLLQVAALGSEAAARDLVQRLKKSGFAAIVEKVEVKDGARYRVRVGPFTSREEAEQARGKLREAGFQASVVAS